MKNAEHRAIVCRINRNGLPGRQGIYWDDQDHMLWSSEDDEHPCDDTKYTDYCDAYDAARKLWSAPAWEYQPDYGDGIDIERFFISMDSFGDTCPANWEEIASALNALIKEHYDQLETLDDIGYPLDVKIWMREWTDELWENYCSDGIAGVPAPIFEEESK